MNIASKVAERLDKAIDGILGTVAPAADPKDFSRAMDPREHVEFLAGLAEVGEAGRKRFRSLMDAAGRGQIFPSAVEFWRMVLVAERQHGRTLEQVLERYGLGEDALPLDAATLEIEADIAERRAESESRHAAEIAKLEAEQNRIGSIRSLRETRALLARRVESCRVGNLQSILEGIALAESQIAGQLYHRSDYAPYRGAWDACVAEVYGRLHALRLAEKDHPRQLAAMEAELAALDAQIAELANSK